MAEFIARDFDRAINYASSVNHTPAMAQSEPWHERLDEISVPTLVIHGDEDPILPYDHGQALHAAIIGCSPSKSATNFPRARGTWLFQPSWSTPAEQC